MILVQAFMRASRQPHPPKESYWASNVVFGVGSGTQSLISGVLRGVGGILYEPYLGAKANGLRGGFAGIFKGIGGLVGRPIKGGFDFIAQPIAGVFNTPSFIYKKLTIKKDPTSMKVTNFKIFGIDCNPYEDQSQMLFGLDEEQFGLVEDGEMEFYQQPSKDNRTVTFAQQ